MKTKKKISVWVAMCFVLAMMLCFSFGVSAAETFYSCDFEAEGVLDDWTLIDSDEDGYGWEVINPESDDYSYGNALCSWSHKNFFGPLTPNNYAYTPEIQIPLGKGKVYLDYTVFALDPSWPEEHYSVYVYDVEGNGGVRLLEETLSEGEDRNTPSSRQLDLSAYAGKTVKIGFVHHDVSGQFAICIDNIHVYRDVPVDEVFVEVEKPLIDGVPATTASIPAGYEGYTVANVSWEPADSVFEVDKAYSAVITLEAKDGYAFTDDVTPYVNGRPAKIVAKSAWELKISMDFRKLAAPPPSMFFDDVKTTDWFYGDVEFVYYNGLMNGTGNNLFSPALTTTRGMIVTVLYRLKGEPAVSGSCPFNDVAAGSYYEKAITWAAKEEIVKGYGGGVFAPDKAITREELASIFCRFAKAYGLYDAEDGAMLAGFKDSGKIASWATDSVSWAVGVGLVNGIPGTDGLYFEPQGAAQRSHVAAMLKRLCTTFNY